MTESEGKTHDITVASKLHFPKDSIAVFDRACNDYAWYKQLTNKSVFFITRLKSKAGYRGVERRNPITYNGITSDHIIEFTGIVTEKKISHPSSSNWLSRSRNR